MKMITVCHNPCQVKRLRFKSQNTRKNLPNSSKRAESNFLSKFERAFLKAENEAQDGKMRASGREFAIEGYGRADVLFIAWKDCPESEDFHAFARKNLRITAFEGKMKDWRKGLAQASRYKHFANRSILVLPPQTARIAIPYLQTFRDLDVGLLEFDPSNQRLYRHFIPRFRQARNRKAREKAIHQLQKKLNFS